VEDGALYFQADDGVLYRLDRTTGEEAWRVRLLEEPVERVPLDAPGARYDPFGSDVTVADGRLFLGTYDDRLLAVDPADGQTLWEFEAEGGVLGAPAVSDGRVVFGAFGGKVHALDATTGEPLVKPCGATPSKRPRKASGDSPAHRRRGTGWSSSPGSTAGSWRSSSRGGLSGRAERPGPGAGPR
jgi:outer membrane protein assembly factor BamB